MVKKTTSFLKSINGNSQLNIYICTYTHYLSKSSSMSGGWRPRELGRWGRLYNNQYNKIIINSFSRLYTRKMHYTSHIYIHRDILVGVSPLLGNSQSQQSAQRHGNKAACNVLLQSPNDSTWVSSIFPGSSIYPVASILQLAVSRCEQISAGESTAGLARASQSSFEQVRTGQSSCEQVRTGLSR